MRVSVVTTSPHGSVIRSTAVTVPMIGSTKMLTNRPAPSSAVIAAR